MAPTASASKREVTTPDDHIKFLLIIIKNIGGSIDWGTVANEAKVLSKGAASMRYHRLNKAHGITSTDEGESKEEKGAGTTERKSKSTSKKRGADSEGTESAKKVKNEEH